MCDRVILSVYSFQGEALPNLVIVLVRHGDFELEY